MTIEEKIILVEDIWDSIDVSKEDISLSADQKEELESREEHYKRHPETAQSWEAFKSEMEEA